MSRVVIESRELEAGADLRATMDDAVVRLEADGWRSEYDGRFGFLFANRGAERVEVGLWHVPPGTATY